jgi:hypothetical protein
MASRLHFCLHNLQVRAEEACALQLPWFAVWPRLWLASSCEPRPRFADGGKRPRPNTEVSQKPIVLIERFEPFVIHLHISAEPLAAKVERMFDWFLPRCPPGAACGF